MQLENSIIPVHKQTENLQRLQENVDKTLSCMDHVISYYHVAKDTDRIIREGLDVRPPAELLFVLWKMWLLLLFCLGRPADWTSIWLVLQRFRKLWNIFRIITQTAQNSTQWYSLIHTNLASLIAASLVNLAAGLTSFTSYFEAVFNFTMFAVLHFAF